MSRLLFIKEEFHGNLATSLDGWSPLTENTVTNSTTHLSPATTQSILYLFLPPVTTSNHSATSRLSSNRVTSNGSNAQQTNTELSFNLELQLKQTKEQLKELTEELMESRNANSILEKKYDQLELNYFEFINNASKSIQELKLHNAKLREKLTIQETSQVNPNIYIKQECEDGEETQQTLGDESFLLSQDEFVAKSNRFISNAICSSREQSSPLAISPQQEYFEDDSTLPYSQQVNLDQNSFTPNTESITSDHISPPKKIESQSLSNNFNAVPVEEELKEETIEHAEDGGVRCEFDFGGDQVEIHRPVKRLKCMQINYGDDSVVADQEWDMNGANQQIDEAGPFVNYANVNEGVQKDMTYRVNQNTKHQMRIITINRAAPTETGKLFKCDFPGCWKIFSSQRYLNFHARVHARENRYKCLWDGCGKTFVQSRAFYNHTRQHTR